MTKKYWIQVLVCFLVILIGSVLGVYYYQEYISPESFTIGTISNGTYKELAIKDYLSDDTVLFSQNINDVSFSISENTATYDYNFDSKEFNGLEIDYLIYVNNYIINDITTNAGTISGTYEINFQDVDNETLCSSNISISFTFRSLSSVLRVSLPASDIGYLLNYFKSDNFIITLAESPFDLGDKDGEIDEKVQQIIDLTNQIAGLNEDIVELQGEIADKVQEIADLNDDLANKDEIIAGLQNDIEELQAQVRQLQGSLSEKTQLLEDLQAEYDQLEDDYGELDDEYVALGDLYDQALATIESLQSQVLELEQQVAYYEELLEAYQNSEKLIVTFTVDDFAYEVQLVDENEYATKPEIDPVKAEYTFVFWSLDGINEFNFSTTPITNDITLVAVFKQYQVSLKTWNGLTNFQGSYIWADGVNTYYSYGTDHYVLDKESSTWTPKIWNGLTDFQGNNVWSDGVNIYYSNQTEQYILNKESSTWISKTWNGLTSFSASNVFYYKNNIYVTPYSNEFDLGILNKETSTWIEVNWNNSSSISGAGIWSDGVNLYYSSPYSRQYKLDETTQTWVEITWHSSLNVTLKIYGSEIWSDGENIYWSHSNGSLTYQYVLNKETLTWEEIEWSGFNYLDGEGIWTDGEYFYYSSGTEQYIINY